MSDPHTDDFSIPWAVKAKTNGIFDCGCRVSCSALGLIVEKLCDVHQGAIVSEAINDTLEDQAMRDVAKATYWDNERNLAFHAGWKARAQYVPLRQQELYDRERESEYCVKCGFDKRAWMHMQSGIVPGVPGYHGFISAEDVKQ